MSFLKRICLLTLLVPTFALAEERWFQIEVMIFKNPEIETDNPETWPAYEEITQPAKFIRLKGVSETLTQNSNTSQNGSTYLDAPIARKDLNAFKALSDDERQLVDEHKKIARDRRYELLFHEAWNQPVPGRNSVIPIRIDAGEKFGGQAELQGYLNLYVERFLHINADLHLISYEKSDNPFEVVQDIGGATSEPVSINSVGGISLLGENLSSNTQLSRTSDDFFISVKQARLNESRRLRSRELHYFDNPEFGMLLHITPIELKQ